MQHRRSIEKLLVEIVERKGNGHPDSLADGIAESVNSQLCREYLEKEGRLPYLYSDKVYLRGGRSQPEFGGGRILEPFKVYITCVAEETLVTQKTGKIALDFLKSTLHYFKPEFSTINVENCYPSEHSLQTYAWNPFEAEDTCLGVAYAPLSETERIVIEIEKRLNSATFKKRYPMIGEDIKVLACRIEDSIDLTIACAFVSQQISDIREYRDCKSELRREISEICKESTEKRVCVSLNPDDKIEKGSIYLTVSGTSIEQGDCGMTGRGNRITGVISPSRPMCIESIAGKPLMNHPGKLYGVLALKIAQDIVSEVPCDEACVKLVGKVGHNINEPQIISVEIVSENPISQLKVTDIASGWTEKLDKVREEILHGKIPLF